MNFTNDVLLLFLTPFVVVILVVVYTIQSAANKIVRLNAGSVPKLLAFRSTKERDEPSRNFTSPRHLTVLINPASGSKNATSVFESLRPSLESAGLVLNIIETTGKGQAYRIATQISQQDCDGIVCVGGDGTVHEVVNGLLSRSDATVARHIPIAVIPCGSSNELAHTLGIRTPQQAANKLIRGITRPLDILCITSTHPDLWLSPGRALYSFQGLGWGLTSEMLSVAERLRWWVSPTPLSPLRLTLAAVLTILTTLTLPRYSAKLTFLPLQNSHRGTSSSYYIPNSPDAVSSSSPLPAVSSQPSCTPSLLATSSSLSPTATQSTAHTSPSNNMATDYTINNINNNSGHACNTTSSSNTNLQVNFNNLDADIQTSTQSEICAVNTSNCIGCEQPMKFDKGKRPSSDLKDWVVVDGKTDSLLFFAASNTPGKLSPHAHLSDGYMDISLITHCSRLRLTRLLMKDDRLQIPSESSSGEPGLNPLLHNNGYHIRQYKTSQIRIEIDRSLPLIVDGELLELPEGNHPLSLDIEVLRSLCYIVC